MHLTHRKTCRICGSSALTPVIDLGDQFLQGSFVKNGKQSPPTRKIPTSLVRCNPMIDERACGLLQTAYTVPPEVLYSVYWYRSGTNSTMRNHLRGIVDEAQRMIEDTAKAVLDIGCNDGTLLNCYPRQTARYGIDPSDIIEAVPDGITAIRDLFPSQELKHVAGTKFDVITSIAMFYDLEDPLNFVREVKSLLAPDGMWIFEMSYMPLMLEMNSYDTICHEHIEYYSLAVIENLLGRLDMRVVRAELNDINGGSLRCYATHGSSFRFKRPEYSENIKLLRQREFDQELDSDRPYRNFQDRINVHREELNALLKRLKRQNKRIHVYGASTKGNVILQWCGIDNRIIDYAAERNPEKFGATTLGTDIPIISEEESRRMKPDYYLVLPWHFKTEFVERERQTVEQGTGLIFPLPSIEIIPGKDQKRS